jgi:hypothetical protein
LFINYSAKAIGMAQYAYGRTDWTCSIADLCTAGTVELVRTMLSQQVSIRNYLSQRQSVFAEEAYAGGLALAEALSVVSNGINVTTAGPRIQRGGTKQVG